MPKRYSLLFVFVLLFWQLDRPLATAADNASPTASNKVEAANAALKRSLDIGQPNVFRIRQSLYSGNFSELEGLFDELFRQCQKDVDHESPLQKGYEFFRPNNTISPADLDLWVTKTDSYMAYAARGAYRQEQGFDARGDKYFHDTPESNIKQMIYFHNLAARDLQIAISKNPQLMPAYGFLLGIAKASSMPFSAHEIALKAEMNDKRSYYVRYRFIKSLLPRWGGSYEVMSAFAQHAIQFSDLNPRLWTLQGEVEADRGDLRFLDQDYAAAIQFYTMALQFGDRLSTINYRALCYEKIGEKEKAIADYKKVLYYDPADNAALRGLRRLQES